MLFSVVTGGVTVPAVLKRHQDEVPRDMVQWLAVVMVTGQLHVLSDLVIL